MIERYFPKSIWQQLFVVLALLVVIPLVILGALLVRTSTQAVTATVMQKQHEIALHATGEIEEFLSTPRQLVGIMAAILGTVYGDAWDEETAVVELALQYPMLSRLSAIGEDGQEVATSELGASLADRSDDPAFLTARQGKSYISSVHFSDDHVPFITFAEPIRVAGKIKGVFLAEVNFRRLWDIVDSIQYGGESGALLVDDTGRLLSHRDKKMVLLEEPQSLFPCAVTAVAHGQNGSCSARDRARKEWLVSYAPIRSLNWGLIVFQSRHDAARFSSRMRMQSFALILISIVAAIGISLLLARFMSRPLQALIAAAGHVAKGDLQYRLSVSRHDEVGKLLASFNTMIQRMEDSYRIERLSIIGRAATAIAHELKNSLVLVNTFICLLPRRHADKKFIDEFSSIVPQELNAWKAMLQNMMDYSHFRAFPVDELVDVDQIVEGIKLLTKYRVEQKQVRFNVSSRKDIPAIVGNSEKLRQVILNLITNAIEATPTGGSIDLSTAVVASEGAGGRECVTITIENTGAGIPSEELQRLFEPFYTTKKGGLGLGLAISKEIVERHGGTIEAGSNGMMGATFVVKIPVAMATTPLYDRADEDSDADSNGE